MHALELLRKGLAEAPPVVAVVGDEPFLRAETIRIVIRAALGASDPGAATRFAGDEAKLADVLDELQLVPMFEKRRVVLVDGADPFITAHRKELEVYVERPSQVGVLVLLPKSLPSNTRLSKLVDRAGLLVETKSPSEKELLGWLSAWSKANLKTVLDEDAARLLVELVGAEVGLLVSEVEKLSTFVGEKAHVRRDDVSRLVGAGRVESIWRILDEATTGKAAAALVEVDRLVASGEHPVGLLAAMTTSLRKVHHAGTLRLQRRDAGEACKAAGIPPFAVEATVRQHAHLGPSRVARLPAMLLAADLDLKGNSSLPPRVVLERLIVELASPRRD